MLSPSQSESEEELDSGTVRLTPPLMSEAADQILKNMYVPAKSNSTYQKYYNHLKEWAQNKGWPSGYYSETLLVCYFKELADNYAPSTLFTRFSAIKSVLTAHRIMISFEVVEDLLKKNMKGHRPKKAGVLPRVAVENWILHPTDDPSIIISKCITLIAICGAMRIQEVTNLQKEDLDIHEEYIVVNYNSTKTSTQRSFVCRSHENERLCPVKFIKTYLELRKTVKNPRLWLGIGPKGR